MSSEEVEPMEESITTVTVDEKEYELNCEQSQVLEYVIEKVKAIDLNPFYMFVSGPAGTGKTLLLRVLQNNICQILGEQSCFVTASTELSAVKINSETITKKFNLMRHDGFETQNEEVKKRMKTELKKSKILMIDVVNFVPSILFSHIDFQLQNIIGKKQPFGGLSILVFGDLLQLLPNHEPPIYRDIDMNWREQRDFKTPKSPKILWSLMEIVELRENERSSLDHAIILDKIRSGDEVGFVHQKLLEMCKIENDSEFGSMEAIEELKKIRIANPGKTFLILVPNEEMAEEVHKNILSKLAPANVYEPQTLSPTSNDEQDEEPLEDLELAVGCQVMLLKNVCSQKLYAGELGIVSSLEENMISVQFTSGIFNIERYGQQFPIRHVDALTIEDCQGIELDGVILVAKEYFDSCQFSVLEAGHIYTALSRARTLNLCRITPLNSFGWMLSKTVLDELDRIENRRQIEEKKTILTHVYLSENTE